MVSIFLELYNNNFLLYIEIQLNFVNLAEAIQVSHLLNYY